MTLTMVLERFFLVEVEATALTDATKSTTSPALQGNFADFEQALYH